MTAGKSILPTLYPVNIGHFLKFKTENSTQVKYLHKHIKCLSEMGKTKELPTAYGYLSVGYLKLGMLEQAESAASTQAEMAVECKDERCILQANTNLGKAFLLA